MTLLSVGCLTLCDNTERPEILAIGTNELIGPDPARTSSVAANGRAVEERRNPSEMGRQGGDADCTVSRKRAGMTEQVSSMERTKQ
jgi:UDP-N-acetylglucosamine 2-epimerase